MDCAPTCLRMIAKHYGRVVSIEKLRRLCETTKIGSSMSGLSNAAEKIGFRTLAVKIDLNNLIENAPLPCIAYWNEKHFVVIYKIKKGTVYIADPAHGLLTYSIREFLDNWIGKHATEKTEEGVVLLLESTPVLSVSEEDDNYSQKGLSFFTKYLNGNKKLIVQLSFGLLAGSILQLILPFLTQSIVDVGIQNKDIHFLYLILFCQLFIFFWKEQC
jgi:ATP-binding cassette subfamily B protein